MSARKRYSIYVVELSKKIWSQSKKFRDANPQYNGVTECLYVGMTSQSPEVRFKKHKSGHKMKNGIKISAYFVEKYGLYLRPSMYRHIEKLDYNEALEIEKKVALELRSERYAVWFN